MHSIDQSYKDYRQGVVIFYGVLWASLDLLNQQYPYYQTAPPPPHSRTIQQLKHDPTIHVHSILSELHPSSPHPVPTFPKPHQHFARRLLDQPDGFGEVMRLAYVYGGKVQIDEECLYFLQKYSSTPIAIVGVVGQRSSGKSLLLDTMLNLSSAPGNQFTTVYGEHQPVGIYLWSQAYSYSNASTKVFWAECSGLQLGCGQLHHIEQILLDLLMVISSTLVLLVPQCNPQKKTHIFHKDKVPTPQESNAVAEMVRSAQRILNNGNSTTFAEQYWPQNLFYLHRNRQPPIPDPTLDQLFSTLHKFFLPAAQASPGTTREQLLLSLNEGMSHFHPSYPAAVSSILQAAVPLTAPKRYGKLKYNGNIVCKLLINTIKYLNRKPNLKLDKVFHSLAKQIYQHSLQYHMDLYNAQLQAYLSNESPLNTDQLYSTFTAMAQPVLGSFNQFVVQEDMHRHYQETLTQYISQKETAVIDINAKKTNRALLSQSRHIQFPKNYDKNSISQFIFSIQTLEPSLDHQRTSVIAHTLLEYSQKVEARLIEETRKREQEKVRQLQEHLTLRKEQLRKQRQANEQNIAVNKANRAEEKSLKKEVVKREGLIKQTGRNIEEEKRYQKEVMISKESKKKYAQKLLQQLREEEERYRDNERIKKQVEKDYQYHPQILQLQKKLDEYARNIKQVQKIEERVELSALASRSQFGKSSIIRSAVQKPSSIKQTVQSKKPIKRLSAKR